MVLKSSLDSAYLKKVILDSWGYEDWREGQEPIVEHMLEKKGDCIISIPTGGGKSIFVPRSCACSCHDFKQIDTCSESFARLSYKIRSRNCMRKGLSAT